MQEEYEEDFEGKMHLDKKLAEHGEGNKLAYEDLILFMNAIFYWRVQ